MADNSAALAAMLMAQQGRPAQQYDPFARQRRYAEALMTQGASTTPVQSPLEGIARALTGGVGGFFAGQADRDEKEQRQNTTSGLLEYANATALPGNTPEQIASRNTAMAAAQEKLKGADPSIVGALAAQLIGQNASAARGAAHFNAVGPVGGGATAGPAPSGSSSAPPPADVGAFLQTMSPQARAAAQATGLDPRVVLAQSAHETRYGQAAPGNNFFGVKGPGQILNTMEAGPGGQLVPTQASFKTYGSPSESAADYVKVMQQPNMAGVLQAPGMTGQIKALGSSGYATDPQYAQKVGAIASQLSPLDPTDPTSAFTMGRPGLAATASGTQINPNTQPPPFVQPQPQPQVAQAGPAAVPPIATSPEISPQALQLDQAAQRLAAGGDMEGAKAMRMKAQEVQAAYVAERSKTTDTRTYDQQIEARKQAEAKAEEERRYQRGVETEAQKNARESAEKDAVRVAPQAKEYEDIRKARGEAATLVGALQDYEKSFGGADRNEKIKSVLGMNTPTNTAYNNAALLAKGEALYNLGVLSGPDLDIIRRTLADPSTLKGSQTTPAQVKESVGKVIDLLQSRIVAKEQQLKLPSSDIRKLADDARGGGFPAEAVNRLKANPGEAALFDQTFGPGSAAKVLGR